MKYIIIAMILIAQLKPQCTDGCLSCTDDNQCLVCDVTNGYFMQDNLCQKSQIKNCQTFDLGGFCFICKQGYYTDPHAEQCISAVGDGELDTNCQRFNLERQCVQCRENYYLLGSSCIAVPDNEKIENCLMYNALSECIECKEGYTLNLFGTICLVNSEVDNCIEQSSIKCNQCKDGYTLNANYFLIAIQNKLAAKQYSLSYPKINNYINDNQQFEEGCLQNIGNNCLMYKDFNECIACKSDHYLKDGQCYSFPQEEIENCRIYENVQKCKECQQGYYLTNTNNCQQIKSIETIPNCVIYNPKANTIQCLQCKNNYFTNSNTSCAQRSNDVAFCKKYSDSSDKCQECNSDYHLTDDGLKCLPFIDNCLIYSNTQNSSNITQLTCQRCNRGLYFNTLSNTCQNGNINNCQFYETDANQCKVCDNKYYLQDGNCLEHNFIENCGQYSNTQPNQCETCDGQSISMTQTTTCDSVEIKGCKVYESTQSCLECEDGYDLTNKLCTLLNVDLHCRKSSNGVCELCQDQYFLANDKLCYQLFQYEKVNCINNKNDGTNSNLFEAECNVCQDYHIPFNLKNHNVCLSVHEFAIIDADYEIPNCQRYKVVNQQIKCKQCEITYILNENDNECKKNCDTNTDYKLNFHFENDGVFGYQYKDDYYCRPYGGDETKSVTLNNNFEVTSLKLKETYAYKYDFSKMTNFKLILPKDTDGVALSQDLYKYPDYTKDNTFQPTTDTSDDTDSFFIKTKGETVDKCEFYFQFRTVNYCSKCQFGYFGQIDFYKIDNCHKYDDTNEQCEECVYQYKLSDDKHKCEFQEVGGCTLYELNTAKCLVCEDTFYLDVDNNLCKQNNVTDNCSIHDPYVQSKCLICDKGYLLNPLFNECGAIIENCRKTIYVEEPADSGTYVLQCEVCNLGYYYKDADKTVCIDRLKEQKDALAGITDLDDKEEAENKLEMETLYCWEFENETGNCSAYRNILQVHQMNKCTEISPYICEEYNNDATPVCTKCVNGYYMVGGDGQDDGICCKYFTHPGTSQDPKQECVKPTDTKLLNCKKFERISDGSYVCNECEFDYYMNTAAVKLDTPDDESPKKFCCPYGFQQGLTLDKQCDNFVEAQPPNNTAGELTCSVFDLDQEKCMLCKEGEYFHKNKCCPLNKYHDGSATDSFIDCNEEDITNLSIQNCTKVNDDNKCIECTANFTLKDHLCCNLSTHYFKRTSSTEWECETLQTDCTSMSSTWNGSSAVNKCETCAEDHYLTENKEACCQIATDETAEVYQSNSCQILNDIAGVDSILNCKKYFGSDQDYRCETCTQQTQLPSLQARTCCDKSDMYDFDLSTELPQCRPNEFVYQNCKHIISYDSIDGFCKECKDEFYKINNRCSPLGKYMKLRRQNTTPTWEDTTITDSILTQASTSDEFCIQVEYVRGQVYKDLDDNGSPDEDVLMKCLKCKEGYKLNPSYTVNTTLPTVVPCIEDTNTEISQLENCILFNPGEEVCQQTQSTNVFKFGYCGSNGSGFTYKTEKDQPCCPQGQYWDSTNTKCANNTITGCLIQNNTGSTCELCDDGYILNSGKTGCDEITKIDNCLEYATNTTCERCKFGYYLTAGTQTTCTLAGSDEILENCAQGTTSPSTCTNDKCHPGYYKELTYCCKLGWFQRTNDTKCQRIVAPNCSKFDENGQKCLDCFTFENQQCYASNDWIFKLSTAANSPYIIETQQTYTDMIFFKQYYLYDDRCCKIGMYWKDGMCQDITLSNCLRLGSSESVCIECKPNFKIDSDNCVAASASDTGYYTSNSKVCQENYYYDAIQDRCLQHPDANCKEASNQYECNTCNDNYTQSEFYTKLIIENKAGERDGCQEKLPDTVFKTCVKNDTADDYPIASGSSNISDAAMFKHKKMFFRRQNCDDYDLVEEKCKTDECSKGYYLANDICCKHDEYPFNDKCIKKKTMLNVCNNYDTSNYECKGCNLGYTLSNNYCCLEGSEYDKINDICIQKPNNCEDYFIEQNLCKKCKLGTYMNQYNKCCPYYQYYDQDKKECQDFTEYGLTGCKEGEKDYCYVCNQQQFEMISDNQVKVQYVKSNGKCCKQGYEYNKTLKLCVSQYLSNLQETEKYCKTYTIEGICQECIDGYYVSVDKCCPLGSAKDSDSNDDCVTHQDTIYCSKWTFDSTNGHKCQECKEGSYLTSEQCCPFYYSRSTDNKCELFNAIDLSSSESDKNSNLSLGRNCKIFDTTKQDADGDNFNDFYPCKQCQDNYYLSEQANDTHYDRSSSFIGKKCCQDGTFYTFNNVDGCQPIDLKTLDNYPDAGQLFLKDGIDSQCIQADIILSTDADEYKNFIFCIKCAGQEVAEILVSNMNALLTSYLGDKASNNPIGTTFTSCVTRDTSKHNDKCWAHFVDGSGDVKRYCRNYDQSKYYLSWISTTEDSQLEPCEFGQYYDSSSSGDKCRDFSNLPSDIYSGCKTATTTTGTGPYTCTECEYGYYYVSSPYDDSSNNTGVAATDSTLDQPYCLQEGNTSISDCLIEITRDDGSGSTETVCIICNPGYGFNGTSCTQISSNTPQYCSSKSHTAVECNYCSKMKIFEGQLDNDDNKIYEEYKTYLTEENCCLENQVFDSNLGHCAAIDDCLATQDNTKKINECIFCNYKKDLFIVGDGTSGAKCCKKGTTILGNTMCEQPTNDDLIYCKFYSNDTTCRQATDLEKQYLTSEQQYPCFSTNYYFNNDHCCKLGFFYDSSCQEPGSSTVQYNCSKFKHDSTTDCDVCKSSSYMTENNLCCPIGKYLKPNNECDDISTITGVDSNCNKYLNGKCQSCSNNLQINLDGCCGNNYRDSDGNCVEYTAISNCGVQYKNQCIKCKNGHYYTGNECCLYGNYRQGSLCVSKSEADKIEDCMILNNSGDCLVCNTGKRLSIDRCCDKDKLQIKSSGDCIDLELVLNCLEFNAQGECQKCVPDDNIYKTNNMCCPLGQKYNTESKECQDIDQYCLQVNDGSDICNKCIDGYYINPLDTTKCCREQLKPGDLCRQVSLKPDIKNCARFDSDSECVECQDNYNLYEQVCCPNEHILLKNGTKQDHCVKIDIVLNKCDQFDAVNLNCGQCEQDYYNGSEQKVCCPLGQQFDLNMMKCVYNHSGCKIQQFDQCTECLNGFYLTGNKLKRCCQETQYFNDDEGKCIDIEIENCQQMVYENDNKKCIKCSDPSVTDYDTHLTNGHCCFSDEFWDPKALKCSNPIRFCTSYEKDSPTPKCLSCSGTKHVLKNQTKCCERQTFYFSLREDEECVEKAYKDKFSWNCAIYDQFKFECIGCREGYYLMNKHCCKEGTYHKSNDDFQVCTGTFDDNNCAVGTANNDCTKCLDGYKINSQKECVKIYDNCEEFNVETPECTKCKKDYFLTQENKCCQAGYQKNPVAKLPTDTDYQECVVIDTNVQTNCIQLNPDEIEKCKVCERGYYLVNNDYCCQNRFYCSNKTTSVQGKVFNCQEYNTSDTDCSRCEVDHSLMTIKDNVKYCYSTPFEDCLKSEFVTDDENENINRFECKQCPAKYEMENISPQVGVMIRHYLIEHCMITDTLAKYSDSTFKCKQCDYDYYLTTEKNCVLRTKTQNCMIRKLNEDKCERCEKGYYLNTDGECLKQSKCELEIENTTTVDGTCAKCINERRFVPTLSMSYVDQNGDPTINKIEEQITPINYSCQLKTEIDTNLIEAHKPEATPPPYFPGMINKCERHYQCKEDYLNGLDINLHKYLSCHVCIEDDRIPFISLDLDKAGGNIEEKGIKRFSYQNLQVDNLDKYNKNKFGKSSQCFKSDLSEFNATSANGFPDNCGVGILNSAVPIDAGIASSNNIPNTDSLGVFCAACKPGYKPSYSNIDYHVNNCQLIENCIMEGDKGSKKSFNECDHCVEEHYHPYKSDTGLDKSECFKSTDNHDKYCYAFDIANNQCKICLNGYSKNHENMCEKIDIPYCENNNSNFKTYLDQKDYRLAFYRGTEGCSQCQQGYLQLYRDSLDDYTCIYSQYAKNNSFKESNPQYTTNCKRYYQDNGTFICNQCQQNFIITDQKQCIAINNQHENCVIAKDINECYECNTNTVLVKGKCLQKSIEHCMIYKQNQEELLCDKCNNGFYLENKICKGGQILNCNVYTSEKICTSCKDGYQLIKNELNQYFCMQITSDINCQQWNQNSFNTMMIKCETCDPLYYLNTSSNINTKVCIPLQTIDGCLEYNINSNYSVSTLMCDRCQINMYTQEGKCLIRKIKVDNCIEYNLNKDSCKQCSDGFYISEDELTCIRNPTGIKSCLIYNDQEQCILCKPSFYLMNSKCFSLKLEELIENCQGYDQEKKCMKCDDDYVLEDNECKLKTIVNCLVYENSSNCKVCLDGYGLENQNGSLKCANIPIVTNCDKYQVDKPPFICLQCVNNYYLDFNENQCIAVEGSKLISNCIRYNNDQTCQACDPKYVLTLDKTQCVLLNHRSNCDSHVEVNTPFCMKCEIGYVLNQDYECVEGPQKQLDNCLVNDINNSKVCALCKPGYFMKNDKKCYKSNIINNDEEEDDDTNGNDDDNNEDDNNENDDNEQDPDNNTDNGDNNEEGTNVFEFLWMSISTFIILLY